MIFSALTPRAQAAAPADPASPGSADPVSFESAFLSSGTSANLDLSRFEKQGYVPPGTYHGDIRVNKSWRARTDIVLVGSPDGKSTLPCYDASALVSYGIDLGKVAADKAHPARLAMPNGKFCGDLGDYIPGATAEFDPGEQSLSLSVPQIYTLRGARGYIDPSQWDAGINAALLNYNANVYNGGARGATQSTGYLGLNGSLNIGSWHLYHLGALSWTRHTGAQYQTTSNYLQHDIPAWKSQLVVGDTFTAGDMFDSVRLRGVRIYTDTQMLPQSLRGYAPVIHGIAETNAHVVVRQNGYIVYDTTVAPGPFVIDDLYPTGYGGDLNVDITEADGRVRSFTQPYAALPQLLRPGQQLWSVAAGRVDQAGLAGDMPVIGQLTYQRGLSNLLTGYAGATLSGDYHSVLGGMAFNTSFGAISTDISYADNHVPGSATTRGVSYRAGYSRSFSDTGTSFSLAAYRYATPGFVGLSDAMALRTAAALGNVNYVLHPRNRMDVTINQSLGDDGGQLYLNASSRDYWNNRSRQVDFSAGYSNHWKAISYSVSVQRTRDTSSDITQGQVLTNRIPGSLGDYFNTALQSTVRDTRIMLNMTIPLGRGPNRPTFTGYVTHADTSGERGQASLNGSLGENGRFTYNASLSHDDGTNASLSGQYNGAHTNLASSVSYGSGYRQAGTGASGSVVVHAGGITFAPPSGDTVGLVYAPGAGGARVSAAVNARVDATGYAVVPNLLPYQLNTVELDPKGAADNVELKSTTQNVAPRLGSVVRLRYEVDTSRLLLIDAALPNGEPVPFGAEVLDEHGNSVGVAGQASRLVVRGVEKSGTLTVRWGGGEDESCRLNISIPPPAKGARNNRTQILQSACTMATSPATQRTTGGFTTVPIGGTER
ncbi:MAG TPA: fimbria/pilus outer membrane usher protein [Dyella sp.]|uniref:fimbria/pilus outer membrane usher protein n=1 Tax=Dyella sp. TaxID=1869338 RepID=UPI002BB4DC97|nr:fimbria/pilus outer membrane usher protein [Dyella sp.]HTV87263.1 fimbria/pilus outer membrane usher protein [Dyella sp.]